MYRQRSYGRAIFSKTVNSPLSTRLRHSHNSNKKNGQHKTCETKIFSGKMPDRKYAIFDGKKRQHKKRLKECHKILYKNLDLKFFPTRFRFTCYGYKCCLKIFPRFSVGRKCALLAKSWPKMLKCQPSRKSWGGVTYRLRRLSPREIVKHFKQKRTQHVWR